VQFNEQQPDWQPEGTEPPASKKATGFVPGEKPPADYFNWLFTRISKVTAEIRSKLIGAFSGSSGHGHTGIDGDGPKITSSGLANGAATDTVIGNRVIDDSDAANSGPNTITKLFNFLANRLKVLTGETSWLSTPAMTIKAIALALGVLNGRVNQDVNTTSSPTFTGLTVNGIADMGGATYGFAVGDKPGRRRAFADSTAFSFLTDSNAYAGLYAGAGQFTGILQSNTQVRAASPSNWQKFAWIQYNDTRDVGELAAVHSGNVFKPLHLVADGLKYRPTVGGGETTVYDILHTGGGQTISSNFGVVGTIANGSQQLGYNQLSGSTYIPAFTQHKWSGGGNTYFASKQLTTGSGYARSVWQLWLDTRENGSTMGSEQYQLKFSVDSVNNQSHQRLQIHQNTPPVDDAYYAGASLELVTQDGSHPGIGFHRGGSTAIALFHDGNNFFPLKVMNNGQHQALATSTTDNMTFYVNPAIGSDSFSGFSVGAPKRSIQGIINVLPRKVEHAVTIYVEAGANMGADYLDISGFHGAGSITILIRPGSGSSKYTISHMRGLQNTIRILVYDMKSAASGPNNSFYFTDCAYVYMSRCEAMASKNTSISAAAFEGGTAYVYNCTLSNAYYGIRSNRCAGVISDNNNGLGNTYAIMADYGGTITLYGTQPGGATSTATNIGGQIRT
jgi:hypothetical protein